MACLWHSLTTVQGRAADALPSDLKTAIDVTLPKTTNLAELRRCFAEIVRLLVAEARHVDPQGAQGLGDVLAELVRTSDAGSGADVPRRRASSPGPAL